MASLLNHWFCVSSTVDSFWPRIQGKKKSTKQGKKNHSVHPHLSKHSSWREFHTVPASSPSFHYDPETYRKLTGKEPSVSSQDQHRKLGAEGRLIHRGNKSWEHSAPCKIIYRFQFLLWNQLQVCSDFILLVSIDIWSLATTSTNNLSLLSNYLFPSQFTELWRPLKGYSTNPTFKTISILMYRSMKGSSL